MKHKTHKKPKPKIVRTANYNCAYVTIMAVLIIFPVILQTGINLIMLSIGGRGRHKTADKQTAAVMTVEEKMLVAAAATACTHKTKTTSNIARI